MPPDVDTARQAHQQYLSTGSLRAELLRDTVFRAWERSHLQGASPRRIYAVQLDVQEIDRLLERHQRLIQAARPYMRALSQAAGAERHAAMLGDARAVVLDVVGDPRSVDGPERVPGPGALLAEEVSGANGIGTPLAEAAYVELVGAEHFIEGFHPFTCQGVPVRDPDGAVAGVVSVSMRRTEAARRLREILICAVHGIEAELIRERLGEDLRRVVAAGTIDEGLLEKLRQDIVQSQATARLEVQLAARDFARDRLQYAMRLLSLAHASIASFERQSALWRDLVSMEQGAHRSIELDLLVRDLAALLRTEAATGRIALELGEIEPVRVDIDPRGASRELFRDFLRGFDVARGGGSVRVSVRRRPDATCEVHIEAIPPPGGTGPSTIVRAFRLSATPLEAT